MQNGKFVCIREERLGKPGNMQLREEKFESIVTEAVIEQGGPIRRQKVSGKHESLTEPPVVSLRSASIFTKVSVWCGWFIVSFMTVIKNQILLKVWG